MNKQLKTKDGEIVSLGVEWCHVFGPGTGYTWNPVAGCRHRCRWDMPDGTTAICYAESIAEGLASAAYPEGFAGHYWHPDRLDEPARLKWPAGIFLDSMSDLMGHWVPEEQIRAVLDVVRDTPRHVYFLLTKNAPRLLKFQDELPPNLWVGVSMPPTSMWGKRLTWDQQYLLFKHAMDVLDALEGKAAIRWVSFEPLSRDVGRWLIRPPFEWAVIGAASSGRVTYQPEPEWVAGLLAKLDRYGVPVFFKGNLEWQPHREEFPEVAT